jgi:thioredoxin-related protein
MKIIKFYTKTCGQCKALSRALEDFNLIPIESVDCEEDPEELSIKFQIRSLPTLVIVDSKGEFLRKITGVITKDSLETIVKSELEHED